MVSSTSIHPHQDLIDACKQGDRKAQFRLYQLYSRAMLNICVRMLRDQAAAEDALQEAFVSAFRKLHTFEGRASFGAWLKRIVVNRCLSHLSRHKPLVESLDEAHFREASPAEEPEADLPLDPAQIHEAIKSLPDGCRVIFNLYLLEGYDHQEIAGILGVSVSTSKSQYHRARMLLRERLEAHMIQHEN